MHAEQPEIPLDSWALLRRQAEESAEIRSELRALTRATESTAEALAQVSKTQALQQQQAEVHTALLREILEDRKTQAATQQLLIKRLTDPAVLKWVVAVLLGVALLVFALITGVSVTAGLDGFSIGGSP